MKTPANIQAAIQAYYAERATPEDLVALELWLREEPAHVQIFAEHGMLEWQLLCEFSKLNAAAIIAVLLEAEENPELVLASPSRPDQGDGRQVTDAPFTLRAYCSVAGEWIGNGLRSTTGVIGSVAAVLLITALVFRSFFSGGDSREVKHLAGQAPIISAPDDIKIVATLTATHDAHWAEAVLPVGSSLRAGERLTLTEGFAEITTSRGAVAIVEAPAEIELLDNDNALHLHTGKLVGICESDSSKGFVVRTEHVEVTDLGTRFGVDVFADHSRAYVFDGSVEIASSSASFPAEKLVAGQALQVDELARLQPIDSDGGLFVDDLRAMSAGLELRGQVRFEPMMPADLRAGAYKNRTAMVFHENERVVLQEPLHVMLNSPDEIEFFGGKQSILPVGSTVSSYFIHFDNDSQEADGPQRCFMQIEFNRPIFGSDWPLG